MLHKAVQFRLYPSNQQEILLSQTFGCARWWWNYALNKSIETYKATGKGLGQVALNALLPKLKKPEETLWLADCYSQFLQATTLNLTTAYKNFFEKPAGFPKFKSKHGKQSIQYPQNLKIVYSNLKLPGNIGIVKAKIHRPIEGKIKTVTVGKTPSGKYFASILLDVEAAKLSTLEGKIYSVDLGLKHFAVVTDGKKVSKYDRPQHLAKHEKNLKRKQKKLARKQKDSKSRNKYRKVVVKVYERVSNSRQDFLHKLSYKLVSHSQAVVGANHSVKSLWNQSISCRPNASPVLENLHVKGVVCASRTLRERNHNLAQAISDIGWGTFTKFLAYKLERKGAKLGEIDRWFPSSKLCSNCYYQVNEMPLEVRQCTCPICGTHHDRDSNAALNIRAEGIRMLKADGSAVSAVGGEVRPKMGRKSNLWHSPVNTETSSATAVG